MPKRDELMYKIEILMCNGINAKRSLDYLFDKNTKRIIGKNTELIGKDKHDYCFVIGTGPSLRNQPLDVIAMHPTITSNLFHKGASQFESKYHMFLDPTFGDENGHYEYARGIIEKHQNTIFIVNKSLYPLALRDDLDLERIYFVDPRYVQAGDNIRLEMDKPMTTSLNVIPFSLQCAIYMGYKRIYMLGCEFGMYGRHGVGHFYNADDKEELEGNARDTSLSLLRVSYVHMHHEAIAMYCAEHGIEIINLTPKSNIGEYPAGDLNDVLRDLGELK